MPELIEFRRVTADEAQHDCEGWWDVCEPSPHEIKCTFRPTYVDPRDEALYCAAHRDAVQSFGVDGQHIKVVRL